MTPEISDSVPLWPLYDGEIDAGAGAQAPPGARWLAEQNFKGEKHRVVLLPDSGGRLAAAMGGLGKRQDGLSLWHAAGIVERLPPRRFPLAQEFTAAEGHDV